MTQRKPAGDFERMTAGMTCGEEEPFRQFYASYFSRLYRYLLVMTRGEEELARDCLQETMLRVIRNMRPFEDERVFWGWLSRAARTAFLDEMRRQKRRHGSVAGKGLWASQADSEDRMLQLIDEALEDLDDTEKQLIVGSYFHRRSHASLARDQGITAKAVESRMARIRKRMRAMILERLKNDQ